MAESSVLVSALVQKILEKTTSLLLDEVRGLVGVRKKLRKLEESLRGAQSLIIEAEEKQLEDRSVRIWLSELKDVAYEAEDIVDELHREHLRWMLPDTKTTLCQFLSSKNPLHFRVKMGRRISEVVERLDAIVAQRMNYDVPESTTTSVVGRREDPKNSIETSVSSFLVYSFAEIRVATNGFSESLKIGKGGYGSVYNGKLRGTIVAIKMLDSHSRQNRREFFQEIEVLCQMRHQNLVILIGACFECYALVYEFLPNGSIEDCLRNYPDHLTWKIRTRIIFDICSALKFLHSSSVVHGDIKPHNILIDASFNGKLADFGLCRFLPKGTTAGAFLETNPKGTFEYIDLKFLETGILKASSDLYSFGVTILKLVTGQQPLGLSRRVSDADENTFREMIDAAAGSWPFELAQEMAYWGLQCCYHNEKSSQLMNDMWKRLEDMLAEIN